MENMLIGSIFLKTEKKLQKVWSPNLKGAFENVDGATVPPEKTLLNVGLNDFDVSESEEIIENFEKLIIITKRKFPTSKLWVIHIPQKVGC